MNLEQVAEAIRAELDWRHWGRPGERMQYMRCGAQKGTSIDRCEECRPMREALATLREMLEVPTAATKKDRQWAGIKEWMGEG